MITVTVTARRQITLSEAVLKHLGVKPGEKIELNFLPDGRVELKAAQSTNHKTESLLPPSK